MFEIIFKKPFKTKGDFSADHENQFNDFLRRIRRIRIGLHGPDW